MNDQGCGVSRRDPQSTPCRRSPPRHPASASVSDRYRNPQDGKELGSEQVRFSGRNGRWRFSGLIRPKIPAPHIRNHLAAACRQISWRSSSFSPKRVARLGMARIGERRCRRRSKEPWPLGGRLPKRAPNSGIGRPPSYSRKMSSFAHALFTALSMAFAMGWEILWPLILGFGVNPVRWTVCHLGRLGFLEHLRLVGDWG